MDNFKKYILYNKWKINCLLVCEPASVPSSVRLYAEGDVHSRLQVFMHATSRLRTFKYLHMRTSVQVCVFAQFAYRNWGEEKTGI